MLKIAESVFDGLSSKIEDIKSSVSDLTSSNTGSITTGNAKAGSSASSVISQEQSILELSEMEKKKLKSSIKAIFDVSNLVGNVVRENSSSFGKRRREESGGEGKYSSQSDLPLLVIIRHGKTEYNKLVGTCAIMI